jgi:hypothetical protein
MGEEKISTKSFGDIDAYLVEARSIGGLSGSPVFLNLGITRIIKKQIKFTTGEPIYYLIGLVHGHYDVKSDEIDAAQPGDKNEDPSADHVNTGIAIVVPFHNIDAAIRAYEGRVSSS